MTAIDELSPSQLDYLTDVDHHDHEALVAFDPASGDGVGVARFVRLEDGTSAEAAVTVIDEWQGRGLGVALCNLLAERAREEGITSFNALLLATNDQMHDVLASLGPSKVLSRSVRHRRGRGRPPRDAASATTWPASCASSPAGRSNWRRRRGVCARRRSRDRVAP